MHGVFDVGCVVFQAKNEELFFVKDSEPVQKVHSIQPDLQPHLERRKKRASLREPLPQHFPRSITVCGRADTRRAIRANDCLQRMDFKSHAFLSPHGGFQAPHTKGSYSGSH